MEKLRFNYYRRLEIGFIVSLLIFIFIFFAWQRRAGEITPLPVYKAPGLRLVQIPQTRQKLFRRPKPAKPVIPVASDEPDVLHEVEIEYPETTQSLPGLNSGAPLDAEDLPYLPRQVLEFLPGGCNDQIHGVVELLLLIDKRGRVKKHKIISTSIHSQACLKSVIAAAYKSRWEVVTLPTGKVEYWIKKVYRFGDSGKR